MAPIHRTLHSTTLLRFASYFWRRRQFAHFLDSDWLYIKVADKQHPNSTPTKSMENHFFKNFLSNRDDAVQECLQLETVGT
jgi:hypothetical protein